MRQTLSEKLEYGRVRAGTYGSLPGELHGAFVVFGPCGMNLKILSSGVDSECNWEHVSVSTLRRAPNWQEMCFVKELFWEDEEVVMQLHPAKSEYVNHHPYCLHLWRPMKAVIPTPPSRSVGPKIGEVIV